MANVQQRPRPVEKIDPQALAAAQAEIARRGIDMSLYRTRYFADDANFTVALSYKDKKPGLRGSDPKNPDYEIVISRADNSIVRFSIAR